MDRDLTILLPVYNEREAIESIITRVLEIADGLSSKPEILVVDDGSTDGTDAVLEAMESVRTIKHKGNRGYGAALKTGIRHADGELIIILDADGTYPPEDIPQLLAAFEGGVADMVVGTRVGPDVAIPAVRRPAKWFINQLSSAVAGQKIPDVNSGFRLLRRDIALEFFDILPDGFSFTTTITLGMLQNGYLVEFVPVGYDRRKGTSKIRPLADTLGFIQLILRVALYFQPLKVFLPLSMVMMVLAALWAFASYKFFGRIADASTAVIFMTGFQIAVVGLLAELINARLPQRDQSGRRSDRP